MKKAVKKIPLIILVGFFAFSTFVQNESVEAFSDQIIQRGATGDDVVELQSRLQYIGFYNGTIDGVYGWGTYWAVRNFQNEFGQEVDGLVGPQMKAMLEKSTDFDYEWVHNQFNEGRRFTYYGTTPKQIQKGPSKTQPSKQPQTPGKAPAAPGAEVKPPGTASPSPGEEKVPQGDAGAEPDVQKAINVPEGFSENDIRIMAQAVYGEARGEPYIGQVAVAAVILNRVSSPTFPNTASGVIFEPRAFTAVADGQIYMEPNETAKRAVLDAINGQDPTGNAQYYFNPDTATSSWIWSRPQIKKIGKHIFCK